MAISGWETTSVRVFALLKIGTCLLAPAFLSNEGYRRPEFRQDTWTVKIRPIIDKQIGKTYLAFNPTVDRSFHRPGVRQGVTLSPNFKVAYDVTKRVNAGPGVLRNLGPGERLRSVSQPATVDYPRGRPQLGCQLGIQLWRGRDELPPKKPTNPRASSPSNSLEFNAILNQDHPVHDPMLKLTKKADYGLISLRHIAVSPRGTSSAKEIADSYAIPPALLAKVLQILTKSGFLKSVAGTNGGYKLTRGPGTITALEVIRAIDGPVVLTSCFTSQEPCGQSGKCTVREPLRRVHEAILDLLSKMTIRELASEAKSACDTEADSGLHHQIVLEGSITQ